MPIPTRFALKRSSGEPPRRRLRGHGHVERTELFDWLESEGTGR